MPSAVPLRLERGGRISPNRSERHRIASRTLHPRGSSEAYGELLSYARSASDTPEALERLLRPLLEVGLAGVEHSAGHEPAAVICPWHPIRLAAVRGRWVRCAHLLGPLLAGEPISFTDNGALFFNELRRDPCGVRFRTAVDPGGAGWSPLAASNGAFREAHVVGTFGFVFSPRRPASECGVYASNSMSEPASGPA